MSDEQKTCPKCGVCEKLPRHRCGCIFWLCGSRQSCDGFFIVDIECLHRQLAAANTRIAELEEELARLKEAEKLRLAKYKRSTGMY